MTGGVKKQVFIVDDHPIMRDGISQLINQQGDMEVCGCASSGPEALNHLDAAEPDMLMVDLSLPGMDGIELIKIVRKRRASLPILVLSMHPESLYAERAIRAGAKGYVMKHASADTLLSAIRRVLSGKLFLSPVMAERLLEKAARGDLMDSRSAVEQLSDRELEIFKLMGQGLRPNKIAEDLLLSIKTVETYSLRLKQKLGARDAAELLQMAISWHKELENTGEGF
jgi:DNA-binding NarL/FixJ family response regulator